jgi:ricin-type beta-trefoil lectin protein
MSACLGRKVYRSMRYSRRLLARSRTWHWVAGGLAAMAGVVALSAPGAALGVTQPGDSPCLGSTGSLTLSSSTINAGQSVSASWTTHRPSGCEGVVSQLNGPGAALSGGIGGTGTFTPSNMGVNNYTATVFFAAGSVDVASGSVTVQPPPDSISDPALMCVGAAGGHSADGTPVELEHCNGTAGQQWATPNEDGTIQVMGKCLAVAGGGTASGTAVQLATCDGNNPAQTWGTDNMALINPMSGLCLNATGASTAPGTPLQILDCNPAAGAQQWILPQAATVASYNSSGPNNTVTFHSTVAVNGTFPSFSCTLTVHPPTLNPSSYPTPWYVKADGESHCEIQVLHLSMFHFLLWNGFPVAKETDIAPDSQNATTFPSSPCHAGQWSSAAEALVIPPPSFRPKIGLMFIKGTAPVNVLPPQCLRNNTGQHLKVAEASIQDDGFTVGTVTVQPSNTVPFDIVADQNLESDDQTVDLTVSEGNHTVPHLIGDEEAYALSDISEDGLVLGTVTERDDCVASGDVETQNPSAGIYFDPANPPTVNITVSTCSRIPK